MTSPEEPKNRENPDCRAGWISLREAPPPDSCPDVSGLSQGPTLSDRLPQLAGILVLMPMVLVSGYLTFNLLLQKLYGANQPVWMVGQALTVAGMFTTCLLGLVLRAFRREVMPLVLSARSLTLSASLVAVMACFSLLAQGAGTWHLLHLLGVAPNANTDLGLLTLESMSVGMWVLDSPLRLGLTWLAGMLGVLVAWVWMRRVPWYAPEPTSTTLRILSLAIVLVFLGGTASVAYSVREEDPFDASSLELAHEGVDRVMEIRPLLAGIREPQSYEGVEAEAVKRLSGPGGLTDGEEVALELIRSDRERQPADLLVVARWLDEKLYYDRSRSRPNLDFEREAVPASLELMHEIDQRVGGDALWVVRPRGTLLALEHLLSASEVDEETLLRLRRSLGGIELSAHDLRLFLLGVVTSYPAPISVDSLWGILPYPESALRAGLFSDIARTLAKTPEGGSALDGWELWGERLQRHMVWRIDRTTLTHRLEPAVSESSLVRIAGLPSCLELARGAVELRLYKLEHGVYPSSLDDLGLKSRWLEWEDETLRVRCPGFERQLSLP